MEARVSVDASDKETESGTNGKREGGSRVLGDACTSREKEV